MQSHHFTSHDLDLLESYVHDCIQQLPKLPAALDAALTDASTQIPTRCSSYHTVCTNMLKEVVSLLSLFSPRLCRLIGQVWDLASLNVFVLLQVSNSALQEAQQLRDQLAFIERYHAESLQRQTTLVQRYEDDLARHRVNEQGLRAELQKVRQRANRLEVENGKLHLVVGRVLGAQDTMNATRYDSSNSPEQFMQESDEQNFCEDIAAVGDVEERELYGVGDGDEEALTRIEIVHPLESYAMDFEQLFQALFQGEERSVRLLNEMDRFINSTAVALLWRYGSTEEEHQMMHRMLSTSTVGTQTDGMVIEKPSRQRSRSGDQCDSDNESDGIREHHASSQEALEDEDDRLKSEKHEVMVVTKHQVIPATLRSQLDSRPRIQRVLEKFQLNRILLRLYLEKLECDARTIRRRRAQSARVARPGGGNSTSGDDAQWIAVVRTPLHRFMKEFFLARYEVPALADFHMMEVVKSCFYYHEKLKISLRGAVFASDALLSCLPGVPESLSQQTQLHQNRLQHHGTDTEHDHPLQEFQTQHQFVSADVRVALFSLLCELVPFDGRGAAVDSAAVSGNMSASLTNAVMDVLGDVLELDPAVPSLAAVEEVPAEANWGFPRSLAFELLTRHFPFVNQTTLEDTKAQVARLAPVLRSTSVENAISADCIAVDVFLAIFATTWVKYDQHLENKLRESFRHQLLLSSPFARRQLADARDAAETPKIENIEAPQFNNEDAKPISRLGTRHSTTILPTVTIGATAIAMHASPLELIAEAWSTLENETVSSLDLEELESTFRSLLEAKQLDAKHRHRQSLKNILEPTTGYATTLSGVTEKEFVFHTLQVLRRRRNNYGLRTNSRRPPRSSVYGSQLHEKLGPVDSDMPIPLESLKPGVSSESLAYISK